MNKTRELALRMLGIMVNDINTQLNTEGLSSGEKWLLSKIVFDLQEVITLLKED